MAAFVAQCHALAGVRPTRAVRTARLTVRAEAGNGARVDKYSKSDIMCVLSPCLQCAGAGMAARHGAHRRAWHLRLACRAQRVAVHPLRELCQAGRAGVLSVPPSKVLPAAARRERRPGALLARQRLPGLTAT